MMSGEETREHCKRQERGDEHLIGGMDDGGNEQQPPPPKKKHRSSNFDDSLKYLLVYKQKYGNFNSLSRKDLSLHLWLQNVQEGGIQLTDDQRDRLDGVVKTKREKDDRLWNEKFEKLKAYKEQHGNCSVPRRFKEDIPLGRWVAAQRQVYRNEPFREDRKKQLESIGVVCQTNVRKPYYATSEEEDVVCQSNVKMPYHDKPEEGDEEWMQQYDKLVWFEHTRGHCVVPEKYPDDKSLATWAKHQRSIYARNTIRQDRKDLLEMLGFDTMKLTIDMKWDRHFGRLLEFKQMHGHCIVPDQYEKDVPLGTWVKNQRKFCIENRLRQDRKELLDQHGFTWKAYRGSGLNGATKRNRQNEHDIKWMKQYEKLVIFKQGHGNCLVPKDYEKDVSLVSVGEWVSFQRKLHGQNKMRRDRKELLDKLGFVWKIGLRAANDMEWMQQYENLVKFKQTHGHCLVPDQYEEDVNLGTWVSTQRKHQGQYKMRQDRKELLDQLGWNAGAHSGSPVHVLAALALSKSTHVESSVLAQPTFPTTVDRSSAKPSPTVERFPSNTKPATVKFAHADRRARDDSTFKTGSQKPAEESPPSWDAMMERLLHFKHENEQRDRLLELHWETRQERGARYWNESFEKLKVYKQQHGNCLISSRFKEDPKLAAWVNTQRTAYKKETIHEDRKEKLESIGFVWRRYKLPKKPSDIFIESDAWILRYEKLIEYHHTQGHCLVPLDHKKEKSPAELTSAEPTPAERISSKPTLVKSLSSPEQARKVFNPTLKPEESWDTMMKRLLHFKHRNGHPDVPPNFTKWGLGEWVETQRAIGRNGELHWCKAERLIEVGLTWWGEED
jgi:hypothetical protein